jgi:hypothetical protein
MGVADLLQMAQMDFSRPAVRRDWEAFLPLFVDPEVVGELRKVLGAAAFFRLDPAFLGHSNEAAAIFADRVTERGYPDLGTIEARTPGGFDHQAWLPALSLSAALRSDRRTPVTASTGFLRRPLQSDLEPTFWDGRTFTSLERLSPWTYFKRV